MVFVRALMKALMSGLVGRLVMRLVGVIGATGGRGLWRILERGFGI